MFRTCGHSLELRFLYDLRKTAHCLNMCKFKIRPSQGKLSTASDQKAGNSPWSKFNRWRGARPAVLLYLAHSSHVVSVMDTQASFI